jgi:hypothetical protein
MQSKILCVIVIASFMMTATASPVMALERGLPAAATLRTMADAAQSAARQARAGDMRALMGLLDRAPRLTPGAQAHLEALRAACEAQDIRSDIDTFLTYAGSVLLLVGIIAIVGGIQLVITGADISEGLISIMLGIFFTLLGLSMLAEAGRPDPV